MMTLRLKNPGETPGKSGLEMQAKHWKQIRELTQKTSDTLGKSE